MGVYKEPKSPYWWCSYTLPSGKRIRESTKERTERGAERFLARRIAEGKTPNRQSIGKLLDGLLNDYEVNGKSYSWAKLVVETHLRPAFGALRAEAFSQQEISTYVAARHAKGRKNSTINRELSLLRRSFILGGVPFPRFQKLKENNVRKGFLTDQEFYRLMKSAAPHLQPILIFAYKTGCRKREILDLKWNQVELEGKVVRLNPGETKNKEGRTIPLDEQLVRMFESSRRESDFVFAYRGKKLKSITTAFNAASERAGLSTVVFHDLRRCGVRNLSRAGVPETVIMAISGHRTRSIFDRYNIVSERELHEGMMRREKSLTRFEQEAEALIEGVGLRQFAE